MTKDFSVRSTGIKIDNFYLGPFTLGKGDLAIIQLPNGPYFLGLLFKTVDILTGKEKNENVQLSTELRFVSHISENKWRSMFYPLTVAKYIEKHGNPESNLTKMIYEYEGIVQRTKICTLPGTSKKLLSVLTTLSWTDKIIFDLAGVDPIGAQKVFDIVKKQIGNTGMAVLIDYHYDFKNDCTRFIKFESMIDKNQL